QLLEERVLLVRPNQGSPPIPDWTWTYSPARQDWQAIDDGMISGNFTWSLDRMYCSRRSSSAGPNSTTQIGCPASAAKTKYFGRVVRTHAKLIGLPRTKSGAREDIKSRIS